MPIEEDIKMILQNTNEILRQYVLLMQKVENLESIIAKKEDKLLRIKEAVVLLQCDKSTFHRHKHHIKACGGTQRHPLYYREDVLSLRDKIRNRLS